MTNTPNATSSDSARPDNTALLDAMRGVAISDNADSRQHLYETMLSASFLIPTRADESTPPGLQTVQPGQGVEMLTLQAQDGQIAWAFFTDEEALIAWRPEGVTFYILRAIDLFRLALRNQIDHVVINVAGPIGGRVNAWEMEALARGKLPAAQENVIHDTQILIGAPDEGESLPHELVMRIVHLLKQTDPVRAAYLFMLAIHDRPPQLVLGVRLTPQNPAEIESLMTDLSGRIAANVKADTPLGMLVLSDDLLPLVESKVSAIYNR